MNYTKHLGSKFSEVITMGNSTFEVEGMIMYGCEDACDVPGYRDYIDIHNIYDDGEDIFCDLSLYGLSEDDIINELERILL